MFVVGRPGVGHSAADRERRTERLPRRARHAGGRGLRRRRDAVYQSESALGGVCAAADVRASVGFDRARRRWCWSSRRRAWSAAVARSAIAGGRSSRSPARISSFICCSRTRSFIRYALAARSGRGVPRGAGRRRSCRCRRCRWSPRPSRLPASRSPVRCSSAYRAEPSPTVRAIDAMQAEARVTTARRAGDAPDVRAAARS